MRITDKVTQGQEDNVPTGQNIQQGLLQDTMVGKEKAGLSDSLLGITIGCAGGLVVLIIVVICLITHRKRQQKKKSWDFDWEDNEKAHVCKSAPTSRNPSPKLSKRKSCPDASRGMMVRSMTTDNIPDFALPPERVQPSDSFKRSHSVSALQYQQNLIGNLQPDLYRSFSGYDDEVFYLPPSDHGRLWFSAIYDGAVEQLQVTLVKVRELIGRGRENAVRDPFVKVFLLPDERNCRVSKVRKKTLSPVYNEVFTFRVPVEDIKERILRFSVYDVDKRRVRHSLGHVLMPLKDLDLSRGDTVWKDLENSSQVSASLGDLCVSLTYLPNIDKVKVVILHGRYLRQINCDRDNSVYVKIQMMYGRKHHKTKKTIHQRASTDPIFNESFAFSVSGKLLDSFSFEISVITSSGTPVRHDELYGRIVIGSFMFARGEELLHWQEMMSQPRSCVQKWHPLTAGHSM